MPIFMDVHYVPGIKAKDAAEAHRKDILLEEEYGCKCLTYWIDEERGNAFCLIEAPDKHSVSALHEKAHGLIPSNIVEVDGNIVKSFLGRIYDPPNVETSFHGLKVFSEIGFRTLLSVTNDGIAVLSHERSTARAAVLLRQVEDAINECINHFNGKKTITASPQPLVSSFTDFLDAIQCALAIHKKTAQLLPKKGIKIYLTCGEPVSKHQAFFGEALELIGYLSFVNNPSGIISSSAVKTLMTNYHSHHDVNEIYSLTPVAEKTLVSLCNVLENNWANPSFSVKDFAAQTLMSESSLYRHAVEVTGLSPNSLLKAFRLAKAKDALMRRCFTIAEVAYDNGFASPSYFTSCFKNNYGVLPMTFMKL